MTRFTSSTMAIFCRTGSESSKLLPRMLRSRTELQVKKLNCPSLWSSRLRVRRPRKDGSETGYILLIVMMMATLLFISLAAALPSIYVEGQREKEKELIFRGEQYARAIMLFHEQFKRYPSSVKELLHTNNLSFRSEERRVGKECGSRWAAE